MSGHLTCTSGTHNPVHYHMLQDDFFFSDLVTYLFEKKIRWQIQTATFQISPPFCQIIYPIHILIEHHLLEKEFYVHENFKLLA